MTNTASSYRVIQGIPKEITAAKKKPLPQQFDHMLALTLTIERFDFWFADTDIPAKAQAAIKHLGGMWKDLLSKSDEELGIDHKYTRDGMMALLEDFAKTLDSASKAGLGSYKLAWT